MITTVDSRDLRKAFSALRDMGAKTGPITFSGNRNLTISRGRVSYVIPAEVYGARSAFVITELPTIPKGRSKVRIIDRISSDFVDFTDVTSGVTTTLPCESCQPEVSQSAAGGVWTNTVSTAALASVAVAASKSPAQWTITGVRLEDSNMVATDAYRLHVLPIDHGVGGPVTPVETPVTIPAGPLVKLTKYGKHATISVTGTEAIVVVPGKNDHQLILRLSLVEGEFPQWKSLVIPTTDNITIAVGPELVDAMTIFSAGRKPSTITVEISVKGLTISNDIAMSTSIASNVGGLGDDSVKIGLDPVFLRDLLAVDSPMVLRLLRQEDGQVLRPIHATVNGVTRGLLMPIRLP